MFNRQRSKLSTGWGPLVLLAGFCLALTSAHTVYAEASSNAESSNTESLAAAVAALIPQFDFVDFGGPTFGAPCSTSPCTVYSHSAGVTSVDRSAIGEYVVNFETGRYAQPPICTAMGGGEPVPGIPTIASLPMTTNFTISFPTPNGGYVDEFVTMICTGVR